MKKLFPLCLSVLFFSQATAFAADKKTYTCEEIYALQLANKLEAEDKYNKTWNRPRSDMSYNGMIGFAGIVVGAATGAVPVVLTAVLAPQIVSVIKNLPSREEKVKALHDESSRSHLRFLKDVRKDYSEAITSEEINEIIQAGFDSGAFCEELPKLYSPKRLRELVRKEFEVKYPKLGKN